MNLQKYSDTTEKKQDLWKLISCEWLSEHNDTNDLLALILKHSNIKDINKFNEDKSVSNYLSTIPNFLSYIIDNAISFEKIKTLLIQLNVKFKHLNEAHTQYEKELFEFICDNDLYLIDKDTLKVISSYYSDTDIPYQDAISYTKLSSLQNQKIIEYINDNINTYISHAFIQIAHEESNESIKVIIDNQELNKTQRQVIIEHMNNIFDDIKFVDEVSWNHLLEYQKIKPTWENILKVYIKNDNTITKELIEYLNDINISSELKNQSLQIVDGYEKEDEEDDKFLKDFRFNLYFHNDLSIDSLKKYRSTSHRCWLSIELSNYNIEKIEALVTSGYLCTTVKNFNNIKELDFNDKQFHIQLIEQDYTSFSNKRDQYDLSEEDIVNLLNSSKLDKTARLEIFSAINIDSIKDQISFEIIKEIISNFLIEKKEKIELIINQIDYLNKSETIELVSKLDDKYKKITINKQFEVEHNDLNYALASSLEDKGFIKDAVPLGGQAVGTLRIRTLLK